MQPANSSSQNVKEEKALPKVSIIILNWNSYDLTQDCLLSLQKMDYPAFEVVLVDNGSTDGSIEKLQQEFPCARFISNGRNLGFPAGNNVGIHDALPRNPDYLLLLNNDTVVAPDFLSQLVRVAESDPKAGILNPKIYYSEPSDHIWYAGGMNKPWWSFPKHLGMQQRDNGKYNETREVSFITGCALLIKTEVVRKIGILDEVFFLGFEDVDWSNRALQAGYKAIYVPASKIWHKVSIVTKRNLGKAVKDFYYVRNSILLFRKHSPRKYWPLFALSLGRHVAYRTAGYAVRLEPDRVVALYKGIWSGCRTKITESSQQPAVSTQPFN
ncbi:MAG: glycosyltransferase family 2 protein [Candidatus Angelobacter sp. Gp1-AA117]|nr:MAG: glycosyltransferase family 2 protein [Candidatus Angelobacter sp. Gp1-AA117]